MSGLSAVVLIEPTHLLVVIVLEAVSVMMMMMMMVRAVLMIVIMMVMVVMIMMVIIGVQKRRLDVENTIEIEGVAAEHFIDVDILALGAVKPHVCLRPRMRASSSPNSSAVTRSVCDQYDIRECDLILRFGWHP